MEKSSALRKKILQLVEEFYQEKFKPEQPKKRINYGGRIFDEKELINLVDSSLDFWLTAGRYSVQFETEFAKFLNVKFCSLTNSGSSANLLAFMALTSPKLKDHQIKKGDEIITVAAGFPTTITPIIQYGAVPVFIDVKIPTYNIKHQDLEDALTEKTKAIMIAHTLGNPFDLNHVKEFCDQNNLWLIEDNCDALGSQYLYKGNLKYTGTIGDIGTSSFYPPHHITMGEGGAVYTNNPILHRLINSFRDWGRDCWCSPGRDNTCQKRFSQQFGTLPFGYDHKYVFSHFGYNLKITDMQAAIGCAQLQKLPSFIKARRTNWKLLKEGLLDLENYFILPEPTKNSKPSWFGFLLTLKKDAPFKREEIIHFLELNNIQTRMLFAGNLIKHPCFDKIRNDGTSYKIIKSLDNTDLIMNYSFWLGVYPGLKEQHIKYMIDKIHEFIKIRCEK